MRKIVDMDEGNEMTEEKWKEEHKEWWYSKPRHFQLDMLCYNRSEEAYLQGRRDEQKEGKEEIERLKETYNASRICPFEKCPEIDRIMKEEAK